MGSMFTTAYPICTTPGCEQEIYLRPGDRDVCDGCRVRGGPPPAPPAVPAAEDLGIPAHLVCSREGCTRFVMDAEGSGRTECLMHHKETVSAH